MLLRIISPNGELREIEKVVLTSELRVWFNGGDRRVVERCNLKASEPNGIAVLYAGGNVEDGQYDELFISNLKADTIREIMRKMVQDRYFDFTTLDYQPRVKEVCETVVDGGKSLPYTSDFVQYSCGSEVFSVGWPCNPLRHIGSIDEVEDKCDEDGESDADHESDEDGEDDGVKAYLEAMGGIEVL